MRTENPELWKRYMNKSGKVNTPYQRHIWDGTDATDKLERCRIAYKNALLSLIMLVIFEAIIFTGVLYIMPQAGH
jgi:hypothetical protein